MIRTVYPQPSGIEVVSFGTVACVEGVDDRDIGSSPDQCEGQVRADEAEATGHQTPAAPKRIRCERFQNRRAYRRAWVSQGSGPGLASRGDRRSLPA